ncbi:MAG: Gfo/Idh/MocA family oxidoreductase [Lentisphaerae bacterium]|nr:Gfo/Idh/MocA family oxidoreductase [Lentisphaerota bacterium]
MSQRRRYVQIGLGGRHKMFREAALKTFRDTSDLVALCDVNPGRLRLALSEVRQDHGRELNGYGADDFERMIRVEKPDCVIVTTPDYLHDHYLCRAMELGCDVMTEKPMTIDADRCARILSTRRRTGRTCTVTFNYRYSPPRTQVKDLLLSGVIGDVVSVDFHWLLDLHHGADYFRRWHRNKRYSGGLLVHKATHHFDLINWWLGSVPESVYAAGRRAFYVPATAARLGLRQPGPRCHGCAEASRCPFKIDLAGNESLRRLYLDCEGHDGYFRDRCVFSPDIDIEDSMNLTVRYRNEAIMTYSLNAFSPWEGYVVTFNGTAGRLEHKCEETVYINADGSVPGALKAEGTWIRLYPHRAPAYDVKVWAADGGHGGADPVMLTYVFDGARQPADRYLRAADERSGAWSILTGVAGNRSMAENRLVRIAELVPEIGVPEYPNPAGWNAT